MEDRVRLFKLVQVVKSVSGDGIKCKHGDAHLQNHKQQQRNRPPVGRPIVGQRYVKPHVKKNESHQQAEIKQQQNVVRPVRKGRFTGKSLGSSFIATSDSPEGTEDVAFRPSTGSPLFRCRKTLNFDSEDESGEDLDPINIISLPQKNRTTHSTQEKLSPEVTKEVMSNAALSRNVMRSSSNEIVVDNEIESRFSEPNHRTFHNSNKHIENTASINHSQEHELSSELQSQLQNRVSECKKTASSPVPCKLEQGFFSNKNDMLSYVSMQDNTQKKIDAKQSNVPQLSTNYGTHQVNTHQRMVSTYNLQYQQPSTMQEKQTHSTEPYAFMQQVPISVKQLDVTKPYMLQPEATQNQEAHNQVTHNQAEHLGASQSHTESNLQQSNAQLTGSHRSLIQPQIQTYAQHDDQIIKDSSVQPAVSHPARYNIQTSGDEIQYSHTSESIHQPVPSLTNRTPEEQTFPVSSHVHRIKHMQNIFDKQTNLTNTLYMKPNNVVCKQVGSIVVKNGPILQKKLSTSLSKSGQNLSEFELSAESLQARMDKVKNQLSEVTRRALLAMQYRPEALETKSVQTVVGSTNTGTSGIHNITRKHLQPSNSKEIVTDGAVNINTHTVASPVSLIKSQSKNDQCNLKKLNATEVKAQSKVKVEVIEVKRPQDIKIGSAVVSPVKKQVITSTVPRSAMMEDDELCLDLKKETDKDSGNEEEEDQKQASNSVLSTLPSEIDDTEALLHTANFVDLSTPRSTPRSIGSGRSSHSQRSLSRDPIKRHSISTTQNLSMSDLSASPISSSRTSSPLKSYGNKQSPSAFYGPFAIDRKDEHAYFPSEHFSPQEARRERICHSAYNYGVPSSVDNKLGSQKLQKPNIKVVVRKRPMTKKEFKRQEVDIVEMQENGGVVLQELKVAVDLSKYIQEVIIVHAFIDIPREIICSY